MHKISTSVSETEVANFSKVAGDWWNPEGVFKSLHGLNPLRVSYLREMACQHFGLNSENQRPLKGLTMLDVGCGGGLLSEAVVQLGAKVVGVDASSEAIKIAKSHAKAGGVLVDYRVGNVEELAAKGEQFDFITAFEIVEHVADVKLFVRAISKLLKKDGLLLMATMNRTTKSFLLGVVMAEYVLGWVPKGAHDWDCFVKPSELARVLENFGLNVTNLTGVVFDPFEGKFVINPHKLDVNYMITAANGREN